VTLFLRDVQDHVATVLDTIDHDRELLAGLLELYMTHESNKMNEVMKVLTVIATLFIPLTFVAGVYGMNFRFMPELEQPWGYPAVLLLMLGMTVGLLLFFRQKMCF
jgi:magnesium transporter